MIESRVSQPASGDSTPTCGEQSPLSKAINTYLTELQENGDIKSPFYKEVLSQANAIPPNMTSSKQSLQCADNLTAFIVKLQGKRKKESSTIRIMEKLKPLVNGLRIYTNACDIMVQAAPACVVLLYGGARLLLDLAQNFTSCFETIMMILNKIGILLSCYEKFSSAHQGSTEMQWLLFNSFKHILSFWESAAKFLNKKSYKIILSSLVKPLDAEWQQCHKDLCADRDNVKILAEALHAESRNKRDLERAESRKNEQREQIVRWIIGDEEVVNVKETLHQNLDSHCPGTCSWIYDDSAFKSWYSATSNTVAWYPAIPGAGKTILASTLVNYLQNKGLKTVYFFYSYYSKESRNENSIDPAIRSLALQLLPPKDRIPDKVLRLFQEQIASHIFHLRDSKTAFEIVSALLKQQERIHIIIDGLDECRNREVFESKFPNLVSATTLGLSKWFFTSRIEPDIRRMMEKLNAAKITPSLASINTDLNTYVSAQGPKYHGCPHCISNLISASDGNFLWITVILRIMSGDDAICNEEIMEELKRFPKGMTGPYLRSIEQLSLCAEPLQDFACQMFAMLVAARQPLHLSELRHALSTRKDREDYSVHRLPNMKHIENLCGSLVIFDRAYKGGEKDPFVKLAHKTVQEFFLEDPNRIGVPMKLRRYFVTSEDRNLQMGQACLSYLKFARYHNPASIISILEQDKDGEHSFLKYAATFWFAHLNKCTPSDKLFSNVLSFIQSPAFWTCVAVQSKITPHLFARYTENKEGGYLMTSRPSSEEQNDKISFGVPLPNWLDEYGSSGHAIIEAFVAFIKEWHLILATYPEAIGQFNVDTNFMKSFPGRKQWESLHIRTLRVEESLSNGGFFAARLEKITYDEGRLHARLFSRRIQGSECCLKWQLIQLSSTKTCILDTIQRSLSFSQSTLDMHLCDHGVEISTLWVLDQDLCVKKYCTSDKPLEFHMPETKIGPWKIAKKACHNMEYGETLAYHCTLPNFHTSRADELYSSDSDSDADSDGDSSVDSVSEITDCLILLCDGYGPIWFSWSRDHRNQLEISTAFHPTKPIMAWSHSVSKAYVADLLTGDKKSVMLCEPAGVSSLDSVDKICKEFQFSHCGNFLYYLLCIFVKENVGTSCTLSVKTFHMPSDMTDLEALVELEETPRITYQFSDSLDLQNLSILTHWSKDLFVALPSLSCSPKVVRIRLAEKAGETQTPSQIQTLKTPIFFPSSTPHRRPQLIYKPKKSYNSSKQGKEPTEGLMLALDGLDPSLTHVTPDLESSIGVSASVTTWSIFEDEGWRDWDPILDKCSREIELGPEASRLRGTFVDADKSFSVPIRCGLDWRKKAFLSCY